MSFPDAMLADLARSGLTAQDAAAAGFAYQGFANAYQIPYRGPGSTGLGKPLKSILHGRQIPIYVAAIGPKSVAQTAALADGWLPIYYSPYRAPKLYQPSLDEGFRRAGRTKGPDEFDVAVTVAVILTNDVPKGLDALKPMLALYIGGMGARAKNFYNEVARELGYEEAAAKIQDAYLGGRRSEAIAAVPDALVDETSLVGSPERIKDRLNAWKDAGRRNEVGSMLLSGVTVDSLRVVAEAVL